MATVEVKLITGVINKDGTHPVRIRVLHNGTKAEKTLFSVQSKHWKNGNIHHTHPESLKLNRKINAELNRVHEQIERFKQINGVYTAFDILSGKDPLTVLQESILDYSKNLSYKNVRKFKNLADHLMIYKPDASLQEIDHNFMDGFKNYLFSHDRINSPETVSRYLKFFKTVLNNEFRKGNFHNQSALTYKTPTASGGHKDKLTREEFEAIKSVDVYQITRDAFCLMVYLRGIRVGDMLQLQPKNIIGDRIIFKEQKTGKIQDVKIIQDAHSLITRYENRSTWYIIPILTQKPSDPKKDAIFQKHIEVCTGIMNRQLKVIAAFAGVKKKVTTHVARHTFASWSDRAGLTSREIQHLLNHSSIRVTENYLEQLRKNEELDDAAGQVFGKSEDI